MQLSNDPTLSSLPLLATFLKSYARPYLGISPPPSNKQQIPESSEPGSLADDTAASEQQASASSQAPHAGAITHEEDELVEREIRERFKRMCEGYFESVSKKLVIEHKVLALVRFRCAVELNFLIQYSMSLLHSRCMYDDASAFKSRTAATMKHTFGRGRYSRTANRPTRR